MRPMDEENGYDDITKSLFLNLSIDVCIGSWLALQTRHPNSLLRALQNAPGYYFTDGGHIYTRPHMEDYGGITRETWCAVPHPLHVFDPQKGRHVVLTRTP